MLMDALRSIVLKKRFGCVQAKVDGIVLCFSKERELSICAFILEKREITVLKGALIGCGGESMSV